MDRSRRSSSSRLKAPGASTSPPPDPEDAPADRPAVLPCPAALPVVSASGASASSNPSGSSTPSAASSSSTSTCPAPAAAAVSASASAASPNHHQQGRRPSKSQQRLPPPASPSPVSARSLTPRRRSKAREEEDAALPADELPAEPGDQQPSPNKGGHSLRKRARVNYGVELIDGDVEVPSSSSSSARAARKRRSDAGPEDMLQPPPRSSSASARKDRRESSAKKHSSPSAPATDSGLEAINSSSNGNGNNKNATDASVSRTAPERSSLDAALHPSSSPNARGLHEDRGRSRTSRHRSLPMDAHLSRDDPYAFHADSPPPPISDRRHSGSPSGTCRTPRMKDIQAVQAGPVEPATDGPHPQPATSETPEQPQDAQTIKHPEAVAQKSAIQETVVQRASSPQPATTSNGIHIDPLADTPTARREDAPASPQSQDEPPKEEGSDSANASVAAAAAPPPWAHLTPYMDGEWVSYPERKAAEDEPLSSPEQSAEEKDPIDDKDAAADLEPLVPDEATDVPDQAAPEADTTSALVASARNSPAPDSGEPTLLNSPTAAGEEADDGDVPESSQETPEQDRTFRYRKLRSPEEFVASFEGFKRLSDEALLDVCHTAWDAMVEWQKEYNRLGRTIDDYENSMRRRAADAKYEARTRNLGPHDPNIEEPDFVVRGYKVREREVMTETRYLQGQDRIMAAAYGFEYDPHPSKIGRQNPQNQQIGMMTRGRSLRNQPRPTAKASEADEAVVGKRQRRPAHLFDPATAAATAATTHETSRATTPNPPSSRPRRRRNHAYKDDGEDAQAASAVAAAVAAAGGLYGDIASDMENPEPKRRRRAGRQQQQQLDYEQAQKEGQTNSLPYIVEHLVPPLLFEDLSAQNTPRSGRRARAKQHIKTEDNQHLPYPAADDADADAETEQPRRLLTLKIPRGANLSEPNSAITDHGESRPTTSSSDSSAHTIESNYSFRPKRQKRFRDSPEPEEEATPAPKKRAKRAAAAAQAFEEMPASAAGAAGAASGAVGATTLSTSAAAAAATATGPSTPAEGDQSKRKQKIKVVRGAPASRKGTPAVGMAEDGDEPPKDYASMTKSEKMSASMKNRWANGHMTGAVEKRKATLAAKKAAQVAAEQSGAPNAAAPLPHAALASSGSPPPSTTRPSSSAGPGARPKVKSRRRTAAPQPHEAGVEQPAQEAREHYQQPHQQQQHQEQGQSLPIVYAPEMPQMGTFPTGQ